MRHTTLSHDWLTRRLQDVSVVTLLLVGYLLLGCDGPNPRARQERQAAAAASAPAPAVATPVSYAEPAPTPVATGPVTYQDAELAFRERRYEDAATMFSAYVERKPENVWGYYMLGLSAWKAGDDSSAEAAYEEALTRDPRHVKSLLGLARVLIGTGRADEALQEATFAVEIDSTLGQAHRVAGMALDELGDTDGASEEFVEAIRLDSTDVWALNNLGYLYLRVGIPDVAIGPLARAVALAPDNAMFQNNLGMALERTGYAGSAAEAYRAALAADEGFDKARVNLDRVVTRGVDLDLTADLVAMGDTFMRHTLGTPTLATGTVEPDSLPPDLPDPPR